PWPRHPERAAGELLPRVDGQQAGADDLRHVGGLVQRQRDERREERLEPAAGERAPELRQRVPDEEQLQERRRRPEDPAVEADEPTDRAEGAAAPEREEEADYARRRERDERQLDGEKRSPPVRLGGERFPEDVRVEARDHRRGEPTSRHWWE